MKKAFALLMVTAVAGFASGAFSTGGSEMLRFSGYSLFRWDFFGQENADPENNMRGYSWVNWDPRLNEFVGGRLAFELLTNSANAVRLADHYLTLKLADGLVLMGGQFKAPFGYGWTRPGGNMYFADRSYISGTGHYRNYAVRDNGICLTASFAPVTVDLGLFNGTGSNRMAENDVNNQFAGRVTADAAPWLTLGGSFSVIGQPEIEDEGVTTDSWSSSAMDFFAHGRYPMGPDAGLLYELEYAMLGATGPDADGMEKNDGSGISIALGAEFGTGDGFVRAVRPMVRYDMFDPCTVLPEGADAPEDNVNVLDFCVGLDLTAGRNTLQLGARSFSFESDDTDGYTNMYLNWRMRF